MFLEIGMRLTPPRSYVLFQLVPNPTTPKSYTIKSPLPATVAYPLIDVQTDTGKYVKSILLNRSSMLGRTILGGHREYSIQESAEILRRIGGLDVKAEQVSVEEYRGILGAVGFPEWLKDDMTSNMDFIEKWGFFGGEKVERDHEVSLFVMALMLGVLYIDVG